MPTLPVEPTEGTMAEFLITYGNGDQHTVTADTYRESGPWLVFCTEDRDSAFVTAKAVRRIDRTDNMTPRREPPKLLRLSLPVLLSGIGILAMWIGLVDSITAETGSGRLFGIAFVGLGVIVFVGAYGIVVGGRNGPRRTLFGAMVAPVIPLGLYGLQWAGGGEHSLFSVMLITLATLSAVCALSLWRSGVRPQLPSALRSFVAAGAIIGLFQFWYDKEYVPANREAGLTELVRLAASPSENGEGPPQFVTATVTLKNVSGTKVRIIGSHYTLWNSDPGRPSPLFMESSSLDLPTGNWLGPEQEYEETIVFAVPENALPVVRLEVEVHVTKGERLVHARHVPCDSCPPAWEIDESSLVNRLTREARYLVHFPAEEEVTVADGEVEYRPVGLVACISRLPDSCHPEPNRRMDRVYGRFKIGASSEVLLEPGASGATR